MRNVYAKIWLIIDKKERKHAIYMLLLMLLMALFEVLGIGSIMPFLSVIGDPQIVESNKYLNYIYKYFNFTNVNNFLIFLGFFAFIMLLFSAVFKSLSVYAIAKFSNMRRHSIAKRLLKTYLQQPYSFFLHKNSSEISKIILSEIDIFIANILKPSLVLITYSIVSIVLIVFLITIDPILALILMSVFSLYYIIVYLTIRNRLNYIGLELQKSNKERFKSISEILGGIKELKLLGRETIYLNSFDESSKKFSSYQANNQILSQLPQFLVEVLAFGSLLLIALYSLTNNGPALGKILPILGLYALGALKLKPAIQQIYSSMTSLKFGKPALEIIIQELKMNKNNSVSLSNDFKRMSLKKAIKLKKIDFCYEESNNYILREIDLEINANTTVGIIGATGAGKSTLIDIILGLLRPTNGEIEIDGKVLHSLNIRKWQNSIGYVPQSIFLADDSIASNIAFGVEKEEIDMIQVVNVSKMAKIHDVILNLDKGYNTIIGERGVRLSGGQRQRLGIARALYHNPDLLVLDEATSALDNQTEIEVMKTIDNMSGNKTIIMIAHRLSTIENCDKIINLNNGQLIKENIT